MSDKNGGPAFPVAIWARDRMMYIDTGIHTRDYFAAKAMQAMIGTAAAPCLTGLDDIRYHLAKGAYEIADAMLKERAK